MAIPRDKTELENYLVYGIDPKNRRIFFGNPIDWGDMDDTYNNGFTEVSAEIAVRSIKRFEADHPSKPIEIHMNSFGGETNAMLYLKDVILKSSCQIKFYGGGAIMSCATWIMCVCDERYLYPDTEVMIHNGSHQPPVKVTDQNIWVEQNNKLQRKLEKIYSENSRMPQEFWHEVCKRDLFLTVEETIQLGLADKILKPKGRATFRKMRKRLLSQTIDPQEMKDLVQTLRNRIKLGDSKAITINLPPEYKEDKDLVIDDLPVKETYEELKGKE